MIKRCYSTKYQLNQPTYKGCTVHPDWHNFQSFAKWFDDNYDYKSKDQNLDKDLLESGNRVYSKDNCIIVPKWLNSFTLSKQASRGEFPVGVCMNKKTGRFASYCTKEGRKVHLGYFSTPEQAHNEWLKFKLKLAMDYKIKMDDIDKRIYPNVVNIIKTT